MTAPDPSRPRWTVDLMRASDADDIRALFRKVFGQEMTSAHWAWKYGDGRGVGMVVRNRDRLVAYYGGIERGLSYFGRPMQTLQVVDTMVEQGERGVLTRRGPYFLAASTFLDRFIGYGRPYLVGYGFPNERVMRLGELLGVQAPVGSIREMAWPALDRVPTRSRPLDAAAPGDMQTIDRLWERMQGRFRDRIICVRDAAHVRHRYLENPLHTNHVGFVSGPGGDLLGAVVTRNEGERAWMLDVIGHPDHYPALVHQARFQAGQWSCRELRAWVTEPDVGLFAPEQGTVTSPGVRIPTSVCTDGPPPDAIRGAWWLMAGDTDFL